MKFYKRFSLGKIYNVLSTSLELVSGKVWEYRAFLNKNIFEQGCSLFSHTPALTARTHSKRKTFVWRPCLRFPALRLSARRLCSNVYPRLWCRGRTHSLGGGGGGVGGGNILEDASHRIGLLQSNPSTVWFHHLICRQRRIREYSSSGRGGASPLPADAPLPQARRGGREATQSSQPSGTGDPV